MALTKIAGATVYDPAHGVDGVVRDIWMDGGRIVAAPDRPDVLPDRVLDATGLVPPLVDQRLRERLRPAGRNVAFGNTAD